MAIYAKAGQLTKERLTPGARGETFKANLPGYRTDEDRINRTNNHLNISGHDVLNIKYQLDTRLPVLFRYGFAYGYNQMVVPKGRIAAVDPYMNVYDTEGQHAYNAITLANGGVPVKLRETTDVYPTVSDAKGIVSQAVSGTAAYNEGKDWAPIAGLADAYTDNVYKPLETSAKAQLEAGNYTISETNGRVLDDSNNVTKVRPGNVPIGVFGRNEYSRYEDAFNGIMVGPIYTDCLLEMPWFMYKDKAESNPWGSSYGNLFPGAKVKSDENGRFVLSPLSDPDLVKNMAMDEYEAERQQVIGEIYSIDQELVPEGSAKWVQWALEDRLNFEDINPDEYRATNRDNEDTTNNSPFNSSGKYPGYPYEDAFKQHDLYMIKDNGSYDLRMADEYRLSDGIPGLTDGYNAIVRDVPEQKVGEIHKAADAYIPQTFRMGDTNIDPASVQVKIDSVENPASDFTNAAVDALLNEGAFRIVYLNELQGLFTVVIEDKDKADALFASDTDHLVVTVKYKKRGLAGVPTYLDWDGCIGSVRILLQK